MNTGFWCENLLYPCCVHVELCIVQRAVVDAPLDLLGMSYIFVNVQYCSIIVSTIPRNAL